MEEIIKELFSLQDEKFRLFTLPLIPGTDPDDVIGVRAPLLKQYAKKLHGSETESVFLAELPHRYHEENLLHAYLLSIEKDPDLSLKRTEAFLPYIGNWAVCDTLRPKALLKKEDVLLAKIRGWIASSETYTIRFGIECLMAWYLDDRFDPLYLKETAAIRSDEYYVNMMIGWYFATALAKQWDAAVPYLEQHLLNPDAEKKAIRKSIESFRITDVQKTYLRSLLTKR